ncbi:MAG: hypothetical protein WKF87_07790 [Chryseolinea sp.]
MRNIQSVPTLLQNKYISQNYIEETAISFSAIDLNDRPSISDVTVRFVRDPSEGCLDWTAAGEMAQEGFSSVAIKRFNNNHLSC